VRASPWARRLRAEGENALNHHTACLLCGAALGLMTIFRPKTIRGVTYALDHLDPFRFEIDNGAGQLRGVSVLFACHCFTEKLMGHHRPDLIYAHGHEKRAFDVGRHALSRLLPGLITTLGTNRVYRSTNPKQNHNYFFWRQNPAPGFIGPYLVFFNVVAAKRTGVDVLMNVESAYMKPNMQDRGSPVRFSTLIDKTAKGQSVPFGPLVTIKRK